MRSKIILGIIITLVIAFISFIVLKMNDIADYLRLAILPLVTVYYFLSDYKKNSFFFSFLLIYSIGEFISVLYYFIPFPLYIENILYFFGNSLYIVAYIFLMLEIVRSMNFSEVISRFAVHLIILLGLNIYCIVLVSDVTIKSGFLANIYEHILEVAYNITVMILLTVALINYLYRDSKKAMNLLIGTLCIAFSEVIQVAYFYVSEIYILSLVYSILLVIAFLCIYIQNRMSYQECEIHKNKKRNELIV